MPRDSVEKLLLTWLAVMSNPKFKYMEKAKANTSGHAPTGRLDSTNISGGRACILQLQGGQNANPWTASVAANYMISFGSGNEKPNTKFDPVAAIYDLSDQPFWGAGTRSNPISPNPTQSHPIPPNPTQSHPIPPGPTLSHLAQVPTTKSSCTVSSSSGLTR